MTPRQAKAEISKLRAEVRRWQEVATRQAEALANLTAPRQQDLARPRRVTVKPGALCGDGTPYPPGVELPPPEPVPLGDGPYTVRVRLKTPEEQAEARERNQKQAEELRLKAIADRERCEAEKTAAMRVYFIQQGETGAIKIGFSRNVKGRLVSLQASHSEPLRLLAEAPGGRRQESGLHERFHTARISGEWFRPTEELLAYIRLVADRKSL